MENQENNNMDNQGTENMDNQEQNNMNQQEQNNAGNDDTNNLINAVAYLVFFVPLIVDGNNQEYKFHANQGLVLLLLSIVVSVLGSILPVIGWFVILPVGLIFVLVLVIMGIIHGINREQKELPLIGKIKLIK